MTSTFIENYNRNFVKPVRVFLEDVGYNFVIAYGTLLTEEWFPQASEFDEDGYAVVTTESKKKMRIDKKGILHEICS